MCVCIEIIKKNLNRNMNALSRSFKFHIKLIEFEAIQKKIEVKLRDPIRSISVQVYSKCNRQNCHQYLEN